MTIAPVHPSAFVETVISMGKDFCADWINEMIVSRISPVKFDHMIEELQPHVSGNEMNGARYAIATMEKFQ